MSLPKNKRKKAIGDFKKQMKEAQGVEGCFDWISHVENIYEKLETFFKEK